MKKWLQIPLWKRVMVGLLLGVAVGLGARHGLGPERASAWVTTYIYPFGKAFVALIRMLIVPLIFTTLVAGVTSMGDPKRLGTLGAKTLGVYFATTAFAVSLGLLIGSIFKPGKNLSMDDLVASDASVTSVTGKLDAAGAAGGVADRLLAIIPSNPVAAFADGDILPIIFFAILFGVGCLLAGEAGKPISKAIDSAAEAMMKLTMLVMETAPIGVFALIAWVMATKGLGILVSLGLLAFCLYLACFLQIIFVYGGIIKLLKLPAKRFFRDITDAQAVAFSTASSSATLPLTISSANENLGVSKTVASSVLPLGATINMDGTAIYLGLVALFAAQAMGIQLTPIMYVMVALTATLTSIGAAGIPSAGLLLAASVLSVIGVGEAGAIAVIAFIFPFDRLLDMMRTLTNITGDLAVATTVAKWEDELDEDVFKAEPTL
ncbi:MAG: dicarboxylate/amino acid:cation symporter [Maricaulaceae bacterium]